MATHPAALRNFTWEQHCSGLFELPVAACVRIHHGQGGEKDDRVHAEDGIQPQPERPGFLRRTGYSGGTASRMGFSLRTTRSANR